MSILDIHADDISVRCFFELIKTLISLHILFVISIISKLSVIFCLFVSSPESTVFSLSDIIIMFSFKLEEI